MVRLSPRVVYSRHYNISFFGFERLHPFDSKKYGRAWREVRRRVGRGVGRVLVKPSRGVTREELLEVHSAKYLDALRDPRFVAGVLELPIVGRAPGWLIDWRILRPMRWATKGTMLGAGLALQHGLVVNLSGGYHHASADIGHGFSAYADVGLAVKNLRSTGKLDETDKVVYVDLDAHQGNGVSRTFMRDPRVFIYDQFNFGIFPLDVRGIERIDCEQRVTRGCNDAEYLGRLKTELPKFLQSVNRAGDVKLAIYNAGTDIFIDDALGGLAVSADGVRKRDRFVLKELVRRGLPTLVLLSGGYSPGSYLLVADLVEFVLREWGDI